MKQARKKRNPKKQIAMLLVCCMLFTLLPTTALASEPPTTTTTGKNIMLGTAALSGYDRTNDKYKYVYYGAYQQNEYTPTTQIENPQEDTVYTETDTNKLEFIYHSGKYYKYEPIKWRILSMNGNDGTYKDNNDETVSSENAMFLLSEYGLKQMAYESAWNSDDGDGQIYPSDWRYSDAWDWCNDTTADTSFISSSFTDSEKVYFLKTSKDNATSPYTDELKGDTFFFLSKNEVRSDYIKNNKVAKMSNENGNAVHCWLRSPVYDFYVDCVHNLGNINLFYVNDYLAARPAFNLNLSSVLFTSAADGKKTDNVGTLSANVENTGNEYKLTMKDESRKNFSVTDKNITVPKGGSATFSYKNAKTGTNEYISAMIVNGAKEVLYYGQIADEITTNSMINFSIPSDLEYGSYELCFFNEQINGDKETDYSSDFQTVMLNVLPQATLETDPKANVLTYDGTEQELVTPGASSEGTVKYSLSENGTYSVDIPTGKNAGTYTVWYYIEGDTTHSDSDKASIAVTIAKSGSETQVITDSIITYGERLSLTATVGMSKMRAKATTDTVYFYIDESETLLGTAKVSYNNKDSGTATLEVDTTDKQLAIGENTIIADYGGSISLNGSESNSITVTLNPKEVGLTWSGYENLVYDGKAKRVTASAIGFVDGDDVSIEVTGGDKVDAGTYTATAALTGADAKYYKLPTNHTKEYTITKVSSGSAVATYTVKFDTNGGSAIKNQTATEYQKVKEPTAPTKDGYTFAGWYADKELTKAYDFTAKVTKNMTLYAKWIANSTDIWQNPFTDVHEGDWFYGVVKYAHQNKLFAGMSATEFAPNMPMSRGMLVTVLYRLAGSPAVAGAMPFADVSSDAYYRNAILWAVQNDIVSGIVDNLFAPDANITREQLAAILKRYAQYKGYDTTQGGMQIREYNDYDNISGYALNAMTWAVNSGLLKGKGENTIAPQDSATRAEVAAILQRFIEGNK